VESPLHKLLQFKAADTCTVKSVTLKIDNLVKINWCKTELREPGQHMHKFNDMYL
jgi:hypothetical protein